MGAPGCDFDGLVRARHRAHGYINIKSRSLTSSGNKNSVVLVWGAESWYLRLAFAIATTRCMRFAIEAADS
jgi:hypothetical protein